MDMNTKIGFLGTGKMGGILVRGLVDSGLCHPDNVMLFDVMRASAEKIADDLGVSVAKSAARLVEDCGVVFLCVKPQQFTQTAAQIRGAFGGGKCAVSIMAGVKSGAVREALGEANVVRVMPNVACLVGHGASAVARDSDAPEDVLKFAFNLFASLGTAVWVNESQMDAVTALSGSGPAYVFMFLEALTDAGVTVGLDRATSLELALETVIGSATMAHESELSLSDLRAAVSSPDGTTVAATGVLERQGFRAAVIDAVRAARDRGRELGA